jgi:hypothetical protein
MAFLFDFSFEFTIVLNDAVVHAGDLPRGASVRVSVLICGTAVGGPARVAQTVDAFDGRVVEGLLEGRQFAGGAANCEFSA